VESHDRSPLACVVGLPDKYRTRTRTCPVSLITGTISLLNARTSFIVQVEFVELNFSTRKCFLGKFCPFPRENFIGIVWTECFNIREIDKGV